MPDNFTHQRETDPLGLKGFKYSAIKKGHVQKTWTTTAHLQAKCSISENWKLVHELMVIFMTKILSSNHLNSIAVKI